MSLKSPGATELTKLNQNKPEGIFMIYCWNDYMHTGIFSNVTFIWIEWSLQ